MESPPRSVISAWGELFTLEDVTLTSGRETKVGVSSRLTPGRKRVDGVIAKDVKLIFGREKGVGVNSMDVNLASKRDSREEVRVGVTLEKW